MDGNVILYAAGRFFANPSPRTQGPRRAELYVGKLGGNRRRGVVANAIRCVLHDSAAAYDALRIWRRSDIRASTLFMSTAHSQKGRELEQIARMCCVEMLLSDAPCLCHLVVQLSETELLLVLADNIPRDDLLLYFMHPGRVAEVATAAIANTRAAAAAARGQTSDATGGARLAMAFNRQRHCQVSLKVEGRDVAPTKDNESAGSMAVGVYGDENDDAMEASAQEGVRVRGLSDDSPDAVQSAYVARIATPHAVRSQFMRHHRACINPDVLRAAEWVRCRVALHSVVDAPGGAGELRAIAREVKSCTTHDRRDGAGGGGTPGCVKVKTCYTVDVPARLFRLLVTTDDRSRADGRIHVFYNHMTWQENLLCVALLVGGTPPGAASLGSDWLLSNVHREQVARAVRESDRVSGAYDVSVYS